MRFEALKVGELAKRTGLTVRALHHYDEIGLLRPSLRGEGGHRMYTRDDIARLQQVLSLRQLGFSLDEVRACLRQGDFSPLEVIRLHVARLREQMELQRGLCERLEGLASWFGQAEEVSAEQFLQAIEVMSMIETYYTPEQMEYLKKRKEEVGEEAIKKGQDDWAALYAEAAAEMAKGTDPADPRLRPLAARYHELIAAFTGGNKGVEQSLTRLWTEQGDKLAAQHNMDPKLMSYFGKIVESAKG